jgi:hypothetical protein
MSEYDKIPYVLSVYRLMHHILMSCICKPPVMFTFLRLNMRTATTATWNQPWRGGLGLHGAQNEPAALCRGIHSEFVIS